MQGKITAQGKLLQQGTLLVSDPSTGKMKERQVFLFEQIIIFSDSVGPKSQFAAPIYIYKNHIQVKIFFLVSINQFLLPYKSLLMYNILLKNSKKKIVIYIISHYNFEKYNK